METTKPKFISKHKKLLASFFIVALALTAGIVYLRTDGITVGRMNIKASVDSPVLVLSTNVNPAVTVTENLSATWQGNGTVNVDQLILWLNSTVWSQSCGSSIGDCSGIIGPQVLSLIGNQTTVSPTLVAVNILGYSNGNSVISIVFIGNFHLHESWGVINTKQVDFTYASYGN